MTEPRHKTDWSYGLEFLSSGNYIAVNRTLVKRFGLNVAVVLGELASKAMLFGQDNKSWDGWFYVKVTSLGDSTGLGERAQKTAIDELKRLGMIEVKYQGLPKRRWFRVDFPRVMEVASGRTLQYPHSAVTSTPTAQSLRDGGTVPCTAQSLVTAHEDGIYSKTITRPEEETMIIGADALGMETLFPVEEYIDQTTLPTKRDLAKARIEEDVDAVLSYLSERTGANYSLRRNDNRMNIRARLKEGYTVNDCKCVIDKKARKWLGTEYADNLNPATLFDKRKFDIYLNQPESMPKGGNRDASDDKWSEAHGW